jgi:hypothetical protein
MAYAALYYYRYHYQYLKHKSHALDSEKSAHESAKVDELRSNLLHGSRRPSHDEDEPLHTAALGRTYDIPLAGSVLVEAVPASLRRNPSAKGTNVRFHNRVAVVERPRSSVYGPGLPFAAHAAPSQAYGSPINNSNSTTSSFIADPPSASIAVESEPTSKRESTDSLFASLRPRVTQVSNEVQPQRGSKSIETLPLPTVKIPAPLQLDNRLSTDTLRDSKSPSHLGSPNESNYFSFADEAHRAESLLHQEPLPVEPYPSHRVSNAQPMASPLRASFFPDVDTLRLPSVVLESDLLTQEVEKSQQLLNSRFGLKEDKQPT